MAFDESFDLVVLGSGAAGTSAAVTAASFGLKVLLLEKAEVFGGGTTYSYGTIWLGLNPFVAPADRPARDADLADAVAYLEFLSAHMVPTAELERFLNRSLWAMRLLEQRGVAFKQSQFVPDHYFPVAPGSKRVGRNFNAALFRTADLGPFAGALGLSPYVPTGLDWDEALAWGGMTDDSGWDHALVEARRRDGDWRGFGMALAGNLLQACIKAGVTVRGSCEGRRLIAEGGRIAGVEAGTADDRRAIRIEARKGVVIATGGAEGNHELVKKFEDLPAWRTHFPPGVTGDGMMMALEAGAALNRAPHNLRVMLGYELGTPEAGRHFRSAGVREAAAPHTLIVSHRGERFGDESSFQYMVNEIKKFDVERHSFVNYPCFLIMDSQYFAQFSFAGRPKGAPPPDWVPRADTLAGLAERLNIAAQPFAATIAEFNRDAADGVDRRFGRGGTPFANVMGGTARQGNAKNLGSLERAPFYGVKLIPTGMCSITLDIDRDGGVLNYRGQRIPGLFACGNAARDIDAGPGYQAGLSHAQGMTMGCTIGALLAGRHVG